MGSWSFSGRAPPGSVTSARVLTETVSLSRGVHGWRGDWLVNGAGDGLVEIRFDPPMRAHVLGFPVRVRRLRIAVDDPRRVSWRRSRTGERWLSGRGRTTWDDPLETLARAAGLSGLEALRADGRR